jgi:hypothetical protein
MDFIASASEEELDQVEQACSERRKVLYVQGIETEVKEKTFCLRCEVENRPVRIDGYSSIVLQVFGCVSTGESKLILDAFSELQPTWVDWIGADLDDIPRVLEDSVVWPARDSKIVKWNNVPVNVVLYYKNLVLKNGFKGEALLGTEEESGNSVVPVSVSGGRILYKVGDKAFEADRVFVKSS